MEQNIINESVPQQNGYNPNKPAKPQNNLVLAIITTVCCCLPLGIYAIIKACEVNSNYNAGNYEGAIQSANEAKKWSIIGIVAGVVIMIIYYALIFTGVIASGAFNTIH